MSNFIESTTDKLIGAVAVCVAVAVGLYSYPANADTTGIQPDYTQVTSKDYIFKASLPDTNLTDLACLAENIYHEARSDGYAGMYAVAMVTLNRVMDPRYPNTVCDVVKQGPVRESWKTRKDPNLAEDERIYYPRKHRCQFSWYCDGLSDKIYEEDAYFNSVDIAKLVLNSADGQFLLVDITEGATHYHTVDVSPNWRFDRGMMYVSRIGQHLFYRWEIL